MLSLLHQLPDDQYRLLQPVVFPSITQLICNAEDARLKRALADWVQRLGDLSGLTTHVDDS